MRGVQERAISLKGVGTPAKGSSDIVLARAGLLGLPLLASPLSLLRMGCACKRLKGGHVEVDVTKGLNALLKVRPGEVLDTEAAKLFPLACSMQHKKFPWSGIKGLAGLNVRT